MTFVNQDMCVDILVDVNKVTLGRLNKMGN